MPITKREVIETGLSILTSEDTLKLITSIITDLTKEGKIQKEVETKALDVFARVVQKKAITAQEAIFIKQFLASRTFVEQMVAKKDEIQGLPEEIRESDPMTIVMFFRETFLPLLLNARLNKSLREGVEVKVKEQVDGILIAITIDPISGQPSIAPTNLAETVQTKRFLQLEGQNYEVVEDAIKIENTDLMVLKEVITGEQYLFSNSNGQNKKILGPKKSIRGSVSFKEDILIITDGVVAGKQTTTIYNMSTQTETINMPLEKGGLHAGFLTSDKFMSRVGEKTWDIYEASTGKKLRTLEHVSWFTFSKTEGSNLASFRDETGDGIYNAKNDEIVVSGCEKATIGIRLVKIKVKATGEEMLFDVKTDKQYTLVSQKTSPNGIQILQLRDEENVESTHLFLDAENVANMRNPDMVASILENGTEITQSWETKGATIYKAGEVLYINCDDGVFFMLPKSTVRLNVKRGILWIIKEGREIFLDIVSKNTIDPNSPFYTLYTFSKVKDESAYEVLMQE